MIALSPPSMDRYESWAAAVREFAGLHIDGLGLSDGTPADRDSCQELVAKSIISADVSRPLTDGRVHCDYYWIIDGPDESAQPAAGGPDGSADVVGFIALRHRLNDFLADVGGHIGYSVRPSRRRQGIASTALRLTLDRARQIGLERVLITCDDSNVGSFRTIEGCGGVLQDVRDRPEHGYGLVRRYWIELADRTRETERETE
ncbi:MAG TPA: GNAT family N-acetyltransferase [Microlunatus sp.]